ncbi:unnamed protein product [Sphagnum jensenii]|uniref:Sugar phosphate transporter domain-containing protein n=1 Tax=Sphagnum jensenii TaxID=128206 RepID=A0ABP1AD43_9BRYO
MEDYGDGKLETVPLHSVHFEGVESEGASVVEENSDLTLILTEEHHLSSLELERVNLRNMDEFAPTESVENEPPPEVSESVSISVHNEAKTKAAPSRNEPSALLPDARIVVFHSDLRERERDKGGVVTDEDFEREFGLGGGGYGSGGSGNSTPKRRSGSRGRSNNGVLRVENGIDGSSYRDIVVESSPTVTRLGKSHGVTYSDEEEDDDTIVQEMRTSAWTNPITATIMKTIFYVLVWYTFSTCLTLYNKVLLGEKLMKFPAPLLMNTIHFSMQAIISTVLVRFCWGTKASQQMSWRDYFARVVPTAAATALDIDLSNISIVFISVSFATMCKSGAPVFILLFAFAFRLEVPSLKLLGIIVIISFGVMLTVAKETEFQLEGFILVMLSTVMAGFRWTVTQLLLQKEEYGLNNPFVAMSYFTPIMALITVVFSLALEPWHKLGSTAFFDSTFHIFESCALMLLGGTLAFFMVMAEYLLISETSAVTMTIAGVIKEVVTIVVAVFFFHDPFTMLKGVGLVIIIFGVALFNWFKYKKLVEGNLGNHNGIARQETEHIPLKYMTLEDASAAIFQIEDEPEHVL